MIAQAGLAELGPSAELVQPSSGAGLTVQGRLWHLSAMTASLQ